MTTRGGNTLAVMCPHCCRDEISLIVERLSWTWVPSPVVLDHCRHPGGNNDGHIQYRLIIDVVADIDAVTLAIVIIIVVVIKQRQVLHAYQPLCAPPQ